MNPDPYAQDPTGPPPSTAYFDPVTGQPVYLDPSGGGYVPGAAPPPPAYPAAGYPTAYPPGYPAPPYGPYGGLTPGGYYPPTVTGTNSLATASLVMSIIGILLSWCVGIGGLLGAGGAVMGHIATGQIRRTYESGRGLAVAGIVIGWTALLLGILFFAVEVSAPTT